MKLLRLTKFFVSLILALVVIACHDEETVFIKSEPEVIEKEVIVEVPEEPAVEPEVVEEESPSFEGYFSLSGSPSDVNCIRLEETIEGLVNIDSDCFSLVSKNPENGTFGQFPSFTRRDIKVRDGKLLFFVDLNFSSSTHDIEEDDSGSNISGRRRVDVEIFFDEDDRLVLRLFVYEGQNNGNLNDIVVRRTFREL